MKPEPAKLFTTSFYSLDIRTHLVLRQLRLGDFRFANPFIGTVLRNTRDQTEDFDA